MLLHPSCFPRRHCETGPRYHRRFWKLDSMSISMCSRREPGICRRGAPYRRHMNQEACRHSASGLSGSERERKHERARPPQPARSTYQPGAHTRAERTPSLENESGQLLILLEGFFSTWWVPRISYLIRLALSRRRAVSVPQH